MSKSLFRLNWEAEPSLTFTLLSLIKSDPLYQQVFFSTSIEQVKDKYLVAQKICIEFFKDSVWMKDAERRGLVIKTEAGEWKATKKWGSNVANPITSRVLHLRKRFNDGWYKTKCGILHNYTTIEDIPDRRKRVLFRKQHPYYFILRELCQGQQPQAGLPVMTPVEERPDPPTRRRKRSPSTISSDSSDSEGNVPLSARAAQPLAKRFRESHSDIEFIRKTVTPLRALSISLPPEVPLQNETQVFRFGMRPNIAYSDDSNSDSDSEASSASDSSFICEPNTRPQDRTPDISVTPPSPAPSDSPSVVALSCTPDQWEQPKIIRSPPDKEPSSNATQEVENPSPENETRCPSKGYGVQRSWEKDTFEYIDWGNLIGKITSRSGTLPFKAFVLIDSTVTTVWQKKLSNIAIRVGFEICGTSRKFHDQLHRKNNRDHMFIRVIVLKGKISIEFEKTHRSIIKMTPLRFLKFIIQEREKHSQANPQYGRDFETV